MPRTYLKILLLVVLAGCLVAVTGAVAGGHGQRNARAHRLAGELGLGGRPAATLLLNGGFPGSWDRAAGGETAPRHLDWPIPGHRLGRGFGSDAGRHLAIDITADRGQPVRVCGPGLVGYTGSEVKGYGNLVMVLHGGGWVTLYAHLDEIAVRPGAKLGRHEVLGTVGSTGISRGNHLHFALLSRGRAIDPLPYLRGVPDAARRVAMLGPSPRVLF